MRPSKRELVVQSAIKVAGVQLNAVTIDKVADQAGMSKQGVLYHFPTKRDLLLGVQQHIADDWQARLEQAAGAPPEQLTPEERLTAYVSVAGTYGRAELTLLLEAAQDPELMQPIDSMLRRWVVVPGDRELHDRNLDLYLVRLASDGLWLYESVDPVGPELRQRIAARLRGLLALLEG